MIQKVQITPKNNSNLSFQAARLPKKTVIITHKNGKDYIVDRFIGDVPFVSPLQALKDIIERFLFQVNKNR